MHSNRSEAEQVAYRNRVRSFRAKSEQLKAAILIEMGRWLANMRAASIELTYTPETVEVETEVHDVEDSPVDIKLTSKTLSQLTVKLIYPSGGSTEFVFPGHVLEHSYADCATVIVNKIKGPTDFFRIGC